MNNARRNLITPFLIALISLLLLPSIFPSLRLIHFAPFLIIVYYQNPMTKSLWLALACGLIMDLLSGQRFGLYILNYCLTTFILHRFRRTFYVDHLTTLPIMTWCFGCLSTLIQAILLLIFDHSILISITWVASDLFMMPLADALYAFLLFDLPRLFGNLAPINRKESI